MYDHAGNCIEDGPALKMDLAIKVGKWLKVRQWLWEAIFSMTGYFSCVASCFKALNDNPVFMLPSVILHSKWFEPRSISSSCSVIVRVSVVLKRDINTIHWRHDITMTLKMTTAQVVEPSVTVTNSSFQNYTHPDDHTTWTSYLTVSYNWTCQETKRNIILQSCSLFFVWIEEHKDRGIRRELFRPPAPLPSPTWLVS